VRSRHAITQCVSCDPCGCDNCSCGVPDCQPRTASNGCPLGKAGKRADCAGCADVLPDYAYTTVATVLDRLVHKGLVHRRMDRRTIRFTTIATRGTHTAVLMHEALSVDPDADAALVRFAETLSPSEAAVLCGALKDSNARRERPADDIPISEFPEVRCRPSFQR